MSIRKNNCVSKTAVALGAFDGLHTGHMAVIEKAMSLSSHEGLYPCVLIFDEHPQKAMGQSALELLQTAEDKEKRIKNLGADTKLISFERIRNMTPEEFFNEIIVSELNSGAVCCGYDFRFGKGASGNAQILKELCDKQGISCNILPASLYEGEPVSSTRIRSCIKSGEIEKANQMLGRAFSYDFEVVEGDKIGRTISSPTINQKFPEGFIVPRYGVYASETFVDGEWKPSVTNIGIRPTLTGKHLRSETHIIGYDGDLYGQRIPVGLLSFMRQERKFLNLVELKAQIAIDCETAIKLMIVNDFQPSNN